MQRGEDNATMYFKIRMQQSLVLHPFGYSVPVLVDALHSSSAVILVNVPFGHYKYYKKWFVLQYFKKWRSKISLRLSEL